MRSEASEKRPQGPDADLLKHYNSYFLCNIKTALNYSRAVKTHRSDPAVCYKRGRERTRRCSSEAPELKEVVEFIQRYTGSDVRRVPLEALNSGGRATPDAFLRKIKGGGSERGENRGQMRCSECLLHHEAGCLSLVPPSGTPWSGVCVLPRGPRADH